MEISMACGCVNKPANRVQTTIQYGRIIPRIDMPMYIGFCVSNKAKKSK